MRFDRFVGLPWVDKGRGFAGVDCYGLLWLVSRELAGCELPSYSEAYVTGADRGAIADLIADELDAWDEVAAGQEAIFDAVLIREGALAKHVGIVTEPGLMLHVERGGTSQIERYRSGVFAHRIVGFYRYRGA